MKVRTVFLAVFFAALIMADASVLVAQNSQTVGPAADIQYMELIKEDYFFLNGRTVTAVFDRWAEDALKELTNVTYGCFIDKLKYNNSLSACLAMIKSGRADIMMTTDVTSVYVAQRHSDMRAYICRQNFGAVMMLRASDVNLRDSFNAALKKLKDNGRLDELHKNLIKELPAGSEPSFTKSVNHGGTDTVYVGVSGDMPPLDYVAADGNPAGYNVALLDEISKETGKNIEIVTLDSQARFAALESKKIDVFFWVVMPLIESAGEMKPQNSDEEAFYKKFIVTQPYCKVKNAFLVVK